MRTSRSAARAGFLACEFAPSALDRKAAKRNQLSFPGPCYRVALELGQLTYSGGTAPASHRLPIHPSRWV
jgi:hypothetical protein